MVDDMWNHCCFTFLENFDIEKKSNCRDDIWVVMKVPI